MPSVEWSIGAEEERDEIRLQLTHAQLERFNWALDKALEQIETFPESAPMSPSFGRQNIRQIVFGDGYKMVYMLFPERTAILGIIPPGSSQALD